MWHISMFTFILGITIPCLYGGFDKLSGDDELERNRQKCGFLCLVFFYGFLFPACVIAIAVDQVIFQLFRPDHGETDV